MIGQDCYLCASQDAADHVCQNYRFRYIDDLEILELIILTGILIDYDVYSHVPSDVSVDHKFLPPNSFKIQGNLDQLAHWTNTNKMKQNPEKCNYSIFSRAQENFVTRLTVNGDKIDQKKAVKILGCWIDQDAGKWTTNTRQICKSAYSRVSMLTKLKYVGVCTDDLLEIYRLFIRNKAEFMSVLWHSSLNSDQEKKIENIQKVCLKVVLQEMYINYEMALEITSFEKLSFRRNSRCLSFAKRCLSNKQTSGMFPLNPEFVQKPSYLRNTEKFQVNFAHTSNYQNSAVPHCQRLLNEDFQKEQEMRKDKEEMRRARARNQEKDRSGAGRKGARARREGGI